MLVGNYSQHGVMPEIVCVKVYISITQIETGLHSLGFRLGADR